MALILLVPLFLSGLQLYLSKCWNPYVSPMLNDMTCFLLGVSSCVQHVNLLTTSLRTGFKV